MKNIIVVCKISVVSITHVFLLSAPSNVIYMLWNVFFQHDSFKNLEGYITVTRGPWYELT